MLSIRISVQRTAPAVPRERGRRRRLLVLAAPALVTGLVLAGVPGSAPAAGPATQVTFTPLSPAKVVQNNAYVGPNATVSVAVADGTTTVPTGATTVRLTVSVKGSKGGTLKVFPMGFPAAGDSITFAANNVVATATVNETVGLSNKVSVTNVSAAAATVTTTIVGYSTQVTAGGISGSGGTPGQVLTNTGSGAAWGPASTAIGSRGGSINLPVGSYASVGSIALAAGSYWVTYTGDLYDPSNFANAYCYLQAPNGSLIDASYISSPAAGKDTAFTLQGLTRVSSAGAAQAFCDVYQGGTPSLYSHSLTAVSVGTVSGTFASSASTQAARPSGLRH